MVSGTKVPDGDPFLQRQNESSIAVSSRNVCHLWPVLMIIEMSILISSRPEKPVTRGSDCSSPSIAVRPGKHALSRISPGSDPRGKSTAPNPPNPLKSWNAASDPVVRSGPSGFFGYSGIASIAEPTTAWYFLAGSLTSTIRKMELSATGAVNSNTDAIRFLAQPWWPKEVQRDFWISLGWPLMLRALAADVIFRSAAGR